MQNLSKFCFDLPFNTQAFKKKMNCKLHKMLIEKKLFFNFAQKFGGLLVHVILYEIKMFLSVTQIQ